MIQFYMTPGSCTTGIHILLEELEELIQVNLVNLLAGDNKKPEYLALNPRGTIPTLKVNDDLVLTDYLSISWWLGKNYPKSRLLTEGIAEQVRVIEVLNFAVNHIHGQGFARIFTPDKFCLRKEDEQAVVDAGKVMVAEAFAIADQWLQGRQYVVDDFSIADAALFYVEFWANRTQCELPRHCEKHFRTLLQRPSVQRVMIEEGYGSILR